MFLVDSYCLGVKDAFATWGDDLEGIRDQLNSTNAVNVDPSYALKFILGAIEYARTWGFSPHSSTAQCLKIFGDTDPSECEEEFVYGHDGKPVFIPGPHDSREKQTFVLNTLSKHGEGQHSLLISDVSDLAAAISWARDSGFDGFPEDEVDYVVEDAMPRTVDTLRLR